MTIRCPVCEARIRIRRSTSDIPSGAKVHVRCSKCAHRLAFPMPQERTLAEVDGAHRERIRRKAS